MYGFFLNLCRVGSKNPVISMMTANTAEIMLLWADLIAVSSVKSATGAFYVQTRPALLHFFAKCSKFVVRER